MNAFATTLFAATLSVVAVPALAGPPRGANEIKVTYNAKSNKYCISQLITGSRVPRSECRSKADWSKEGLLIGEPAVKLAQKQ
ncbi:MAG TPA: hypothetical protein VNT42_05100 [Sphingomonas sp.]|nr:hypothetical protein [Sphingomonas sp.]